MAAISIEIPEDVKPGLEEASQSAGMSPGEYVLDLLLENLSDRELVRIADERMAKFHAGESKTHTLEEVIKDLGLDD